MVDVRSDRIPARTLAMLSVRHRGMKMAEEWKEDVTHTLAVQDRGLVCTSRKNRVAAWNQGSQSPCSYHAAKRDSRRIRP